MLAGLSSGCDLGPRDDAPAYGPALHVVATYPADGQGTDTTAVDAGAPCDSPTPDCAVPRDLAIELRFDRFLLPGGGLSAGLRLFTGGHDVALTPTYDVVERVVTFELGEVLQPNVLYTAEVQTSTTPSKGFWAFDRAPLEPGPVPLRFSFTTGSFVTGTPVTALDAGAPDAGAATTASSDDCSALPKPNGALHICQTCHGDPNNLGNVPPTPMGLSLGPWGLVHTAIGHVAHESETGNSALDQGLQTPARFGVQMNIVDPGFPADSYLLYKLLRNPYNFRLTEPCVTGHHAPVSDADCTEPGQDERDRLGAWFARGAPMPKVSPNRTTPDTDTPDASASISYGQLASVAKWIANGAPCGGQ